MQCRDLLAQLCSMTAGQMGGRMSPSDFIPRRKAARTAESTIDPDVLKYFLSNGGVVINGK